MEVTTKYTITNSDGSKDEYSTDESKNPETLGYVIPQDEETSESYINFYDKYNNHVVYNTYGGLYPEYIYMKNNCDYY